LRAGVEPQLVRQAAADRLVRVQRIRLPPSAIEGAHQLACEALSQWVLAHEGSQLGQERSPCACLEIGFDAILERRFALFLQAPRLRRCERLV
jgi:hypothetical protein